MTAHDLQRLLAVVRFDDGVPARPRTRAVTARTSASSSTKTIVAG